MIRHPREVVLNKKQYVSASSIVNFTKDNGLADWLLMYGSLNGYNIINVSGYRSESAQKGIRHEAVIIAGIRKENEVVQVCYDMPDDAYRMDRIKQTRDLMEAGTPVIYQGVIYSEMEGMIGVPDLLIRGDYLDKVLKVKAPAFSSNSSLAKGYIYYVCDIKSKNIKLNANEQVSNSREFTYIKTQLTIYNICLKATQTVYSTTAYILSPNGVGVVNLLDEDTYYQMARSARNWVVTLRKTGGKWNPLNLQNIPVKYRSFMMPNLKVVDDKTDEAKKEIALKTGNITLLPFCGQKIAQKAHMLGITSFYDEKCTAEILGFNGNRAKMVDGIIRVNRPDSTDNIHYKTLNLQKNIGNIFLDFEFVHHSFIDSPDFTGELIYHIGVFTMDKGYKCFIVNELNEKNEENILKEFLEYINIYAKDYTDIKINHWSQAEIKHLERSCQKYTELSNLITSYIPKMVDVCELCQTQELYIKGCFSYGLKEVGRNLYNLGFIKNIWDNNSDCIANISLMDNLATAQKLALGDLLEYSTIIKYNQIDCLVMMEIWNLLHK